MIKIFFLLTACLWISSCTDDPLQNNTSNNGGDPQVCLRGERNCKDERTLQTCVDGTQFVTNSCLDNEVCEDSDCVPKEKNCNNKCDPPKTKCDASGKVETCADHDGNGCFEFGDPITCEEGSICDAQDGLCKPNDCTDLCAENETACEDNLITTCRAAANGCLEFAPGKECPNDKTCIDGSCQEPANCTDECTVGDSLCTPEGKKRVCEMGPQGCGVLSGPLDCPAGQSCMNGSCQVIKNCQDLCIAGEKVCVANDLASCEMNAMGCLEFSATTCNNGQTCQNNNGVVGCVAPPQSGSVVINEVFYDPIGDDIRNGKTPTFIELRGPAGLDISGFVIELHNEKNGAVYESYTLAANSKLDGNGLAVIVSDNPDAFLSFALPFFTNVYSIMAASIPNTDALQNGPDGVVLKDDMGMIVDAMSYGKPDPQFFIGEGECLDRATCHAAPDAISGHSVGRVNGADTDDNQADFKIYYPTPGLPNADLIINEAYFNEPGTDTGLETFVELVAPITGWEDLSLDGYVLHAINGFNGNDYIFSGVNPGIEMSGYMLNENGADGYVLICNIDKAGPVVFNLCTIPYEGVDWQNGPDNLVLRFQGEVIDALGFGSFTSTSTFVGEGNPKPFASTDAGKALARWPISDASKVVDTNDNSVDFYIVEPTPASNNPLPPAP